MLGSKLIKFDNRYKKSSEMPFNWPYWRQAQHYKRLARAYLIRGDFRGYRVNRLCYQSAKKLIPQVTEEKG